MDVGMGNNSFKCKRVERKANTIGAVQSNDLCSRICGRVVVEDGGGGGCAVEEEGGGEGGVIMAASAIAISSDSSDESVGSPPSRVILFGDIPTVIPSTSVVAPETSTIAPVISSAAPVVETTLVASPTGLCGLVPYSGSDSDSPDEMSSPEHISPLPAISPFLCTDSSEAPDSSDGPPSQDPYVATVARWRSRDPSRRYGFLIPLRRLFPLVDLNAPSYGPLRAPRQSEAFHPWFALLPLSTLYPPTTSESSSRDSLERPLHSSLHSARPSRKRCRSPVDSVTSSTPIIRSLAPTRADLLPTFVRVKIHILEEEIVEPTREDSFDLSSTRDGIIRSFKDMSIDLDDVVRDFYHHMFEVRIDRNVGIETACRDVAVQAEQFDS
ncbi:hypothetical protein Tco_0525403 [Tanacetum coccineum]